MGIARNAPGSGVLPQPEPIFLGYLPKRRTPRPDWLDVPRVLEIWSVSDCIAAAPDDYFKHPSANAALCFNSRAAAQALIPPGSRAEYAILALWLYPIEFDAGAQERVASLTELFGHTAVLPPEREAVEYLQLGYDVAQTDSTFAYVSTGCSPLSCNHRATDHPVNENCLLDKWEDAVAAARDFATGGRAEPGPYYIVKLCKC